MSKAIWNILGVLMILATIQVLAWISERLPELPPEQHSQFIAGVGLFASVLVAIAAACLFPPSRPVTLGILGVIGIIGCIFNLVEGFHQRNFSQVPITLLLWLPASIYLVVKGKITDDSSTQK